MSQRIGYYLAALALLVAVFMYTKSQIDFNARNVAEDKALTYFVKSVNGTVGKKMKERKLLEKLNSERFDKFVAGAKKAAPGVKADSSLVATFTIQDTTKAKDASPVTVCDEYDRFCIESLANGNKILTRNQSLKFQGVFLKSLDGKIRVADMELQEFRPGTTEMIPSTGIKAKYEFNYVEEQKPAPPILHLRPLVSVNHMGQAGAGLEFLNFERTEKPILDKITLSVNGYWDNKAKTVTPAVVLGYRVFNSNVTVGSGVGIKNNGDLLYIGAASIQLGR